MKNSGKQKNTVPMLEKALDILEYIGASENPVSLPELQRNLGIVQASCYRIAATLVERGWLEKCSGKGYEIAPGIIPVAEKIRSRFTKYTHLQPFMNRLANHFGFSVKFSILDGDEFVNVCSAQCRFAPLSFSEPGFRFPLREIATVSTIFLAEKSLTEHKRILKEEQYALLQKHLQFYQQNGYCFMQGETYKNTKFPFDTLSFPVRNEDGSLSGVLSFLSLPGELEKEQKNIAEKMIKALKNLTSQL